MNAQLKATPRERKKTTKRDKWPKQIRDEDCRFPVAVYRRLRASGKTGFMVANYANGTRVLESFKEEEDAIDRAKDLSRLLSNRQSLAGQLSNEDAVTFGAATELLAPHGLALLPTIQTAIETYKILGNLPNMIKAAQDYSKRHGASVPRKSVSEAVAECIEEKRANGASARYIDDLTGRLGAFASAFRCDLSALTGGGIQQWLDSKRSKGKTLGAQSKINYRRVLRTFVDFCQRKGWLPKDWDELDRLAKVKARNTGEIEIFTPEEMARLLESASPRFLPVLVLGGFCGLRSAEIERVRWDRHINFTAGHVVISADIAKTGSRRIVPLSDNAKAWLAPYAGKTGKVWQASGDALAQQQQKTARRAGGKWKGNALRHSFISYRLAEVQDTAKVALEAGNSPKMIFDHYRELVTSDQGKRWFGIVPVSASNNVIPMASATA